MRDKMNLFLVESPLQLLGAIEAKQQLKLKNNFLIINMSNEEKNNEQMFHLLSLSPWDKVYKVPFFFSKWFKVFQFIFIIYFHLKKFNFDSVFFGEVRNGLFWLVANNINVNSIWMLDDGAGTISVQERIFRNLQKFNRDRNKKTDFIAKLFFLKPPDRHLINIFTMYDIKPLDTENIYENKFTLVKECMQDLVTDKEYVYFIGSNLVRPELLSESTYIQAFNKVYYYYKNRNKKIKYILHRRENRALIEKNFSDIDILEFDNILEIELLIKKIRPYHIASFYSAALFTLKKIYNIEMVDSFLIDLDEIDDIHREAVKACYMFNKKHMNIIRIEDI